MGPDDMSEEHASIENEDQRLEKVVKISIDSMIEKFKYVFYQHFLSYSIHSARTLRIMNSYRVTHCLFFKFQISAKKGSLAISSSFRTVKFFLIKLINKFFLEFLTLRDGITFEQTVATQNKLGDELINLFKDDPEEYSLLYKKFKFKKTTTASQ